MQHAATMWKHPWKFSEGLVICGGLIIIGLLLQWLLGPIDWSSVSGPYNWLLLVGLVFVTIVAHSFSYQFHVLEWMSSPVAAVPTLLCIAALMAVMGLTRQVPPMMPPSDALGVTRMTAFWPFVLMNVYAMLQVGMAIMTTATRWRIGIPLWRVILFCAIHLGLWLVLVCATLGSGDMRRVRMNLSRGSVEDRAIDERHRQVRLPISVKLDDFGIDEYPPEMVVVDRRTGEVVDDSGWQLTAFDTIYYAVRVETDSVVDYVAGESYGAASAMLIGAKKNGVGGVGWISDGNFMYPPSVLFLDDRYCAVMPERRPQRYYSVVDVTDMDKQAVHDTIEVNHPLRVDGWWIYQSSYDVIKGRWSETSVLELVRDPWLSVVYVGFVLMLFGALLLFVPVGGNKLRGSGIVISVVIIVAGLFLYWTLIRVGFFERKMMPALQSPWFAPHIVVYMVGYSALALSVVAALFRRLDLADALVRPGLAMLTFGMLFGAFWAKEAWGTYWSWDPKETWAAATWTLYVLYIHLRASGTVSRGWAISLLVVSFVCLQMCWWGVNYLPSAKATSVHTYTSWVSACADDFADFVI